MNANELLKIVQNTAIWPASSGRVRVILLSTTWHTGSSKLPFFVVQQETNPYNLKLRYTRNNDISVTDGVPIIL